MKTNNKQACPKCGHMTLPIVDWSVIPPSCSNCGYQVEALKVIW